MMKESSEKFKWQLLELNDGITTSEGNWYHITREGIEKYIPGLLKRYRLERIIKDADAWLKSPDVFSLILYFFLTLVSVNPLVAATVSLIYYTLWYFNISSFIIPALNPLIRFFHNDGLIYVLSAMVLIYFSFINMPAMWVGIVLLFLFKVGLLRLLYRYLSNKMTSRTPQSDRVLNMLLIRLGMRHGLLTRNVQEMEQELIKLVNYHKTRKK